MCGERWVLVSSFMGVSLAYRKASEHILSLCEQIQFSKIQFTGLWLHMPAVKITC